MAADPKKQKEVPSLVIDSTHNRNRLYTRGNYLGHGGFARCYELIDKDSGRTYAGKVVSKMMLTRKSQKDKMTQEITIHRQLCHPHVVKMEGYFEDRDNVYILLELCPHRSLMELHKRRRCVTEPEARYFTAQIVKACIYLHKNHIIHRDLKLGNLFINGDMQVKMGDFGLATVVEREGERKMTLCGTPNYIAPEMLEKMGHSYEVDIWAIGCMLYTMLVGRPPFETKSLTDTYRRIMLNQYVVPTRIGRDAAMLIKQLLSPNPAHRPKAQAVLKYSFFTDGFMPQRLPAACLTMAPKFDTNALSGGVANKELVESMLVQPSEDVAGQEPPAVPAEKEVERVKQDASSVMIAEKAPAKDEGPSDYYVSDTTDQLTDLLKATESKMIQDSEDLVELEDPAAAPVYWISKWFDYSDKYGLGYQLSDNSVGVLYNDCTKLVVDAAGKQMQYLDRENKEYYHTTTQYAPELEKKVKLINSFRDYMNNLVKAGANYAPHEGDELARLPSLITWLRTKTAISFILNNGTVQVNFVQDHTKLVICPLMQAVTFVDTSRVFRTYKFSNMEQKGCPKELYPRLKYAKKMIEHMVERRGAQGFTSLSA